ncbi:MAG: hypothetical protein A2V81_01525 [Candidatus Abawacabacteria bacterium RBG_16_42_10]|uniref:Uncharacterized protein n=1 Tax=Candidatus Abawacabacteria bacterium RBG_16_42_10 TaxID=1817814 RepID=A0A1F4XKC3_9BACT|nr:MAG: hypothetical protein A2V81_01525 [Candidatus Abawacabacteria bacterium RBG_16_42_10]
MKTTPNHTPSHERKPSEPKFKPEVEKLPPIARAPEGIIPLPEKAEMDTLGKIPLPTDPNAHLNPMQRKFHKQDERVKAAKEHALYELAYLNVPEINETRDALQEKFHTDLGHTIEAVSQRPTTISILRPEVKRALIENFPGFALTIISHTGISRIAAEAILHDMVQQLGARRVLLLAKSKDKEVRSRVKELVTDMGKRNMEYLEENNNTADAETMLTSSMEMLIAGVLDHLLHFEIKKEDMHDFENAIKLVVSDNYYVWAKSVLTQYPDKELLSIVKSLMQHFPQTELDEKLLERISREKKESIFAKIAPEMSAEELIKILIKRETEATRVEIMQKLGKSAAMKVFKKPKE